MALITCPACGKPISDKAVKCPHCGIILNETKDDTHKLDTSNDVQPSFSENVQATSTPDITTPSESKVSSIDTTKAIDVLIVIAAFIGAISAFVPLFFDVYGIITRPIPALINAQPTPLFHTAMCMAIVGGALSLAALVYGLLRIAKNSQPNLLFWVLSAVIALAASFGTFWTAYYASNSFDKTYYNKVEDARGTYEWVSKEDGTTTSFSMCYNGYVEYHGKDGYVKNIYYDYKKDKLVVEINVDGEESFGCYDSDMKYIETPLGKVPVKKISDSTFSQEEWLTKKQEAEKQAEFEEFNNFRTKDLSAFMLHGKVKSVEESNGGQAACTYYFSEQGELTKAVMSGGDYRCKIKRQTNKLVLSFENPNDEYGGWGYVYTVDNSGRLISYIYGSDDFGDETTYSDFDSHGWPTRAKSIAELGGAVTTSSIGYSLIDEYGNWTVQSSMDDDGNEITTYRSIEYYPIEK